MMLVLSGHQKEWLTTPNIQIRSHGQQLHYLAIGGSDRQPPIVKPGGIQHLFGLQDGRFTTKNTHGPTSIQQPLTN